MNTDNSILITIEVNEFDLSISDSSERFSRYLHVIEDNLQKNINYILDSLCSKYRMPYDFTKHVDDVQRYGSFRHRFVITDDNLLPKFTTKLRLKLDDYILNKMKIMNIDIRMNYIVEVPYEIFQI